MNRQMLQTLASDWTRIAKNDIRTKIIEFMNENETNPQELAYALAISEGEIQQILEGNGEITLSTFAKLLIATGNALEIKPIEQTPIGSYENTPQAPMPPIMPRPAMRTERRNNMFNHERREQRPSMNERPMPRAPFGGMHFPPIFGDEMEEEEHGNERMQQPRDEHGRFRPFERREQRPQSKFASMPREKLVDIINDNLWDSEIDTHGATITDLVNFLDSKDRKIAERKRMREVENDPKVVKFKENVRQNLQNNPHLRQYLKNLLNED